MGLGKKLKKVRKAILKKSCVSTKPSDTDRQPIFTDREPFPDEQDDSFPDEQDDSFPDKQDDSLIDIGDDDLPQPVAELAVQVGQHHTDIEELQTGHEQTAAQLQTVYCELQEMSAAFGALQNRFQMHLEMCPQQNDRVTELTKENAELKRELSLLRRHQMGQRNAISQYDVKIESKGHIVDAAGLSKTRSVDFKSEQNVFILDSSQNLDALNGSLSMSRMSSIDPLTESDGEQPQYTTPSVLNDNTDS